MKNLKKGATSLKQELDKIPLDTLVHEVKLAKARFITQQELYDRLIEDWGISSVYSNRHFMDVVSTYVPSGYNIDAFVKEHVPGDVFQKDLEQYFLRLKTHKAVVREWVASGYVPPQFLGKTYSTVLRRLGFHIPTLQDQLNNMPSNFMESLKIQYRNGQINLDELVDSIQQEGHIVGKFSYHQIRRHLNAMGFVTYERKGLLKDRPELMKDYDHDTNNKNGVDLNSLTLGSTQIVSFLCPDRRHPAESRPVAGQVAGTGCAQCARERITELKQLPVLGVNDLASQWPDVAKDFMADRNGKTAQEVTEHSSKEYFWKPSCGIEGHVPYVAVVEKRIRAEKRWLAQGRTNYCPHCSQKIHKSQYEHQWAQFIQRILTPYGLEIQIDRYLLKDAPRIMVDVPQGDEIDISCVDIGLLIEVNGERGHNKKHGTLRCPKGYEDAKSLRAAHLGFELLHIWQEDHIEDKEGTEKMVTSYVEELLREHGYIKEVA